MAELTPGSQNVMEGQTAELCLSITDPPPGASLPRSFDFTVSTKYGTAGKDVDVVCFEKFISRTNSTVAL